MQIEITQSELESLGAGECQHSLKLKCLDILAAQKAAAIRDFSYSDKMGHRGRMSKLIVGCGEALHKFEGKGIPGVVGIVSDHYTKSGKWSHTDFTLRLAPTAWKLVASQSWEEGEYFHGCKAISEMVAQLRTAGCQAADAACVSFLESAFPKTVERVRAREAELASLGS